MDHSLEKEKAPIDDVTYDSNGSRDAEFESHVPENGKLERSLKGRHMQMIAIGTKKDEALYECATALLTSPLQTGGSIGAGLFVGSGGAFNAGGPGSVVRNGSFPAKGKRQKAEGLSADRALSSRSSSAS